MPPKDRRVRLPTTSHDPCSIRNHLSRKSEGANFSPIRTQIIARTPTVPSPKLQNTRSRLYRGYDVDGSQRLVSYDELGRIYMPFVTAELSRFLPEFLVRRFLCPQCVLEPGTNPSKFINHIQLEQYVLGVFFVMCSLQAAFQFHLVGTARGPARMVLLIFAYAASHHATFEHRPRSCGSATENRLAMIISAQMLAVLRERGHAVLYLFGRRPPLLLFG